MDHTIAAFVKGTQNLISPELIATDAAQDSIGWMTRDGKIVLSYGKLVTGTESTTFGKVYGVHFGYKIDGSVVMYRKINTKIQYLNGTTWTDIITGLTATADYTFANYSSLAGSFTFVGGVDGIWKIVNASPANPIAMYSSTKNYKGKIMIDKGRMLLWGRVKDPTGLYGSYIDLQDSTVYTAISGEVLGASGGTHYTATLAAISGTRNVFGFTITGTTSAGVETFTDNFMGVLASDKGGTGTINYVTGAVVLDFNGSVSSGNVVAGYQWEDSNAKGITDFTKSATRLAHEGFVFRQDEGGDAILNVLIGQESTSSSGVYYSEKSKSFYVLTLDNTDLLATNSIYRKDLGIPNFRAGVSSNKGIVFINTANVAKPEMTILQRSITTTNVEPVILFPEFKFANYDYSDSCMDTWERYVIVLCKTLGALFNNTMLLCDMATGTVDAIESNGRCVAKNNGILYVGSALTENVYETFSGFDEDGLPITNYWISKNDQYQMAVGAARALRYQMGERLKKYRKEKIKGMISPDQTLEIYISADGEGFQLVGTINGSGSYVDNNASQAIGKRIGDSQIGGDDSTVVAYPFFTEIKVNTPYFRTRTIKLVAKGIGYVDVQFLSDWDIIVGVERLPARFRQKSHVSLDGLTTDIATG